MPCSWNGLPTSVSTCLLTLLTPESLHATTDRAWTSACIHHQLEMQLCSVSTSTLLPAMQASSAGQQWGTCRHHE